MRLIRFRGCHPPVPPAVPGSVSGNRTGDELVRRDRSELVSSRHRNRDCRVRGVPDAQLPTLIVAPAPRRPIGADRAHRRAQPACGRARRQPGETTRSERAPPSRGEPPKAANDLSGRASYMRGSRRGASRSIPPLSVCVRPFQSVPGCVLPTCARPGSGNCRCACWSGWWPCPNHPP
jgi:hypothetical protein